MSTLAIKANASSTRPQEDRPPAAADIERARAAPSPVLLRIALLLVVLACLAPLWPAMASLTAAAAVALAALAGLDWQLGRGAAPLVHVISLRGEGEAAAGPGQLSEAGVIRLRLNHPRPIDLKLSAVAGRRAPRHLTLAVMAAENETLRVIDVPTGKFQMRLSGEGPWTWPITVTPRRRGVAVGLRCGIEHASPLRLWRMRQWQTRREPFLVYPDLIAARRELLQSPIYRAAMAATNTRLTGQGREFERLREYEPGDSFADISWKTTARRGFPVTRLFQWEQRQQIYFVIDHSRSSRMEGSGDRTWLDRYVETALAGASTAMQVGDEFGIIAFADAVTAWIPAGSGAAHFGACRERLLRLTPSTATADFDRLFASIRTRAARRSYLLMLTSLAEPGLAESFTQAATLVSRLHVILAAGIRPAGARPVYGGGRVRDVDEIYGRLAGDIEYQRLEALRRQLALQAIQFRAVDEAQLLRTAVEGYLESKWVQRL